MHRENCENIAYLVLAGAELLKPSSFVPLDSLQIALMLSGNGSSKVWTNMRHFSTV